MKLLPPYDNDTYLAVIRSKDNNRILGTRRFYTTYQIKTLHKLQTKKLFTLFPHDLLTQFPLFSSWVEWLYNSYYFITILDDVMYCLDKLIKCIFKNLGKYIHFNKQQYYILLVFLVLNHK